MEAEAGIGGKASMGVDQGQVGSVQECGHWIAFEASQPRAGRLQAHLHRGDHGGVAGSGGAGSLVLLHRLCPRVRTVVNALHLVRRPLLDLQWPTSTPAARGLLPTLGIHVGVEDQIPG